jgi:signal transduction histidine kinase
LTQLVLNLLDNALRHTPGGGRVTLTLSQDPGGCLLQVADSGEGIAPEHLPHLFERFYRADHARSRETGGTGLGLAICNWVASAHGGRLQIESEIGQGTTVSLWLPTTTPDFITEADSESVAVGHPATAANR